MIGPNGAGKTTLFNCISGLYRPDSGGIRFKEKAIEKMAPDRIAGLGIARTFQNIELFSNMNTMENIMAGRSSSHEDRPFPRHVDVGEKFFCRKGGDYPPGIGGADH